MLFIRKLKKKGLPKSKDLRVVNKKTSFWKPFLLMLPAFTILIMFTIVPFILTTKDGFQAPKSQFNILDTHWTLDSFKAVVADPQFQKGIKNSMSYAIMVVPLVLIISALISSAIASVIRKRMRGIIQTIFFLPYITSAIAISLSFAYLFDYDSGLLNKIIVAAGGHKIQFTNATSRSSGALWSMLIYGVWRGLAFNILIFTTAMLSVDKTHYKAASIDGAGPLKQFFKITLPSINKTTNFLITMGIIGAIKVFPLALFNNDSGVAMSRGASTLLLYVYHLLKIGSFYQAGSASVLLVLISIGYAIVVKQSINLIVKGITRIGEANVSNKIKNRKFISKL